MRIFERNARIFDISRPLDAFNFVTFLGCLANEHARNLAVLFDSPCKYVFSHGKDVNVHVKAWTMKAQTIEVENAEKNQAVQGRRFPCGNGAPSATNLTSH